MVLPVPNPSTAAAGAKQLASVWNSDVRDSVLYLLGLQGGVGRRNLLTNSHMDVWQRGTSFTVASSTKTYTADRWAVYRAATGSTASQQAGPTGQSYGLRYQRDSGDTSTAAMRMIQASTTANSLKLAGQSVSVRINLQAGASFSAAGSLVTVALTYGTGTDQSPEATWTGTTDALSATQAITTTATDYTFDGIVIPSSATQVKLTVSYTPVGTASANDWVQLNGAQVTVGSAVGFERLPVQTTLAECFDYYEQLGPYDSANTYIAPGQCTSTSAAVIIINYQSKRTGSPTVTFSTASGFALLRANGSGVAGTGMATTATARSLARIVCSGASGLVAGDATVLWTNVGTTNAIYIDSEL